MDAPAPPRKLTTGGQAGEPPARAAWLVLAALLAHVAEELPAFPEWATRHFGTTSTPYFVLSHVPLISAVAWIVYRATRPGASPSWIWWTWTVQSALAANAVFHVLATLWFGEYSPGVVTGLALYVPVTLYLLPLVVRRLGLPSTISATAAGAVACALLVGSLWLDVTFI